MYNLRRIHNDIHLEQFGVLHSFIITTKTINKRYNIAYQTISYRQNNY